MINLENKKKDTSNWFLKLRDKICHNFLSLENQYSNSSNKFEFKKWKRDGGGGGEMAIMYGKLFEKVGVNVSTVFGQLSKEFRQSIPGAETDGKFWASGISVVSHPLNPHIPSAHMNTRYIVTSEKSWFGGGSDITPMIPSEEMSKKFHLAFENICDVYDKNYYKKFKLWADDYFFLKHRNENRGDGGIFFDYLNSKNWQNDYNFSKDVGETFQDIYSSIIKDTMNKKWSQDDRKCQLEKRGRYVEFNLLYDRGTLFGLKTGGNIEAILMSLPPTANW